MSGLPSGYRLSLVGTDVDIDAAQAFLTQSYWSPGIGRETVARAIAHSITASVHHGSEQVGMARVISDRATFAYLADVYVLEEHGRQGLAQAMLAALHAHPDLQDLRRWMLFTRDAHSLYARLGWEPLEHPERAMLRSFPDLYV